MIYPKPVLGPITSRFGPRVQKPSPHNGQDWGWLYENPTGTRRIYAPLAATVGTGANGLVGNYVTIPIGGGYYLRLCHFQSLAVRNGQAVSRGQFLGVMGDTGSQAAGIHLHLDVYTPSGGRIDPAPYFSDTFVGDLAPAGGGATPTDPTGQTEEEIMSELSQKTKDFITDTVRDQTNRVVTDRLSELRERPKIMLSKTAGFYGDGAARVDVQAGDFTVLWDGAFRDHLSIAEMTALSVEAGIADVNTMTNEPYNGVQVVEGNVLATAKWLRLNKRG